MKMIMRNRNIGNPYIDPDVDIETNILNILKSL